jgi:DNA-binding XRE family transcriptional regulator
MATEIQSLREARRARFLTQTQLAFKAGIDPQTVSRIESGRNIRPSHRVVMKICRALKMHPHQIAEFGNGGSL